ncbi:MAG: hypothetical protein HOE48_08990 [Candidatus Latescibacteria bacterium]|jgi:hypothetical protein|nr:hypothetical protein [Candidatus Latescibacterota bacterium]MBT4138038.1 hypothetical protein [Candidatus Latescibacterota bacterium]MBT5832153.1 hypothetical protein [Candidatus Latescibacterota bacterium]
MDNLDDLNEDLDHAIDVVSEQAAHNTTRLDQLISRLHDRLSRDYTNIPIVISSCMIIGGFLHIYFKNEFIFSLTAMIWGALIFALTLFFRHRISQNLTKFSESLVKLDQDRQDHARKIAVIENIIREGMPNNLSLNHLLALLGEYKGEDIEDDGPSNDIRPENN